METLTRGKLAKRSGVNIETLRYYEKRKLIDPPRRSEAGYRLYTPADILRIRFIKNAQKLGFTLKEIRELLKPHPINPKQANNWDNPQNIKTQFYS